MRKQTSSTNQITFRRKRMGVSFDNNVLVVCEKDEREWFQSLPDRRQWKEIPGSHFDVNCPVTLMDYTDEGKVLHLSTMGYGVLDLSNHLPESCVGVISSVYSCQGQDIHYVESFDNEERFDKRSPITTWERNNSLDC